MFGSDPRQILGVLVDALSSVVEELDPEAVPLPDAVAVYDRFVRLERLGSTGSTLMARRVEESEAWKRDGSRSAEEFLSSRSGTRRGRAKQQLDTSKTLKDRSGVDRAARSGELSPEQAAAIADAVSVNPGAEESLLSSAAAGTPLPELGRQCRQAKGSADPNPEAKHNRIHARRSAKDWVDEEGAWQFRASGTSIAGQRFMSDLQHHRDRCFDEARKSGRKIRSEALTFDALMAMAEASMSDQPAAQSTNALEESAKATGRAAPPARRGRTRARYLGLIRVDLAALRRGRAVGEELCEIAGYGPVPVSVAKDLLGESLLRLVCMNGYDVVNTTALRRAPNAAQLAALLWRSPGCEVQSCPSIARIENDHVADYARTRHTRVDELQRLCHHHHALKTRQNWAMTTDGTSRMVPPNDPDHPAYYAGSSGSRRRGVGDPRAPARSPA